MGTITELVVFLTAIIALRREYIEYKKAKGESQQVTVTKTNAPSSPLIDRGTVKDIMDFAMIWVFMLVPLVAMLAFKLIMKLFTWVEKLNP